MASLEACLRQLAQLERYVQNVVDRVSYLEHALARLELDRVSLLDEIRSKE